MAITTKHFFAPNGMFSQSGSHMIGERSEPHSDKVGGEMYCLACACMFVTIYIYIHTA